MAQSTLKEIVAKKKEKLALSIQAVPEEELKARISGMPAPRPFAEAVNKPRTISLIAEIKKASPSRGLIRADFDPVKIAGIYQEVGVQAVSVLTEEDFFQGSLEHLSAVKAAVQVPVLRKDFLFEPYQIYESRAYGADAVLLIAELLSRDKLGELSALAESLGMDSLVEIHDEKELKKVLGMKLSLIGINNRDLKTFEVDLKTTERLFPLIPKDRTVVVESGLKSSQDVLFLRILGINAVLIGTAFMEEANIAAKVEKLMGW